MITSAWTKVARGAGIGAGTEAKRSMIQANIEDTQRRLKKLGC